MSRSFNYFFFSLAVLLVSCNPKVSELSEKLTRQKLPELVEVIDSLSSANYQYFYSKISTEYKDSSQSHSFKTSVRIASDSAVNAVITFARIPFLNALVTVDSLKLSQKRDKCYVTENLDFFRENFGVAFSLRDIEELITGLPVGFDPNEKYFRVNDPHNYTISSHRKRDIKKNERKGLRELIYMYTLEDDLTGLKSVFIESPEDSALITINHTKKELIGNHWVPELMNVEIKTPKQIITLELSYKRTRVNEVEDIYFVIPEDYEKCK